MAKMKCKHEPKPRGMSYADVLARKKLVKETIKDAARDATLQVQADTQTQRALWLAVASIADAYGFGPDRIKKFFVAMQENSGELNRMTEEVDQDYAYEKLRMKAEHVTGMKIEYLYEHEALAAQLKGEQPDASPVN